jgi:predicted nucleic acid-binding protein
MIARFADTSYWLALLIPNDEKHDRAVELATTWSGPLVTTDWVLVEVGNHLSPPQSRQVFIRFMRSMARASSLDS